MSAPGEWGQRKAAAAGNTQHGDGGTRACSFPRHLQPCLGMG